MHGQPGGADLLVRGGRLVVPQTDELVRGDVLIRNGRIVAIGTSGAGATLHDGPPPPIIDADGLLVLPGGIDPHVHLNDPGFTDREDFYHGTAAAASGGITTVVDMPCTSLPPVTCLANFEAKFAAVRPKAVVDFGFYGGVCAESFAEGFPQGMDELAPHVLAFKCYFISIMDRFHQVDHYQFRRVLEHARKIDRLVALHAEDLSFSNSATAAALLRDESGGESGGSAASFTAGRPEEAEVLAILCAAELARMAEAQLHIVHVSTARGAEIVRDNPFVSGETCPHYLAFDLADFQRIGSAAKVTPPIKAEPNRSALWRAIADGTLAYVASDHAPAPPGGKATGSIWTDYAGIPGCPTLLPFLLSEGCRRRGLSYQWLAEVTSAAAARRFKIADRKGALLPGRDGDLAIIDPDERWVVRGAESLSMGKVTPYEGMELTGRVKHTVVRGREVYRDGHGILVDPPWGQIIRRHPAH